MLPPDLEEPLLLEEETPLDLLPPDELLLTPLPEDREDDELVLPTLTGREPLVDLE